MIQKTGSIHVYFQRNKGHLAGVILCSILAGMGETMWVFVFQKIGELPGDMTCLLYTSPSPRDRG